MNDQLKDDLPGLYRPLGRDHGRQKAQLMALLPEAAPEPTRSPWRRAARLMTGDNTMTMKRRLLKLSPAAAAVAAVVVGVGHIVEVVLHAADVVCLDSGHYNRVTRNGLWWYCWVM